ncbi:MAG: hypothetical protein II364_00020, partial [Bacteroidales bacterium]|nr:hypothetical protein [Bacteroidales bacterium]
MGKKKKKRKVAPSRVLIGTLRMTREGAAFVKVDGELEEFHIKASRTALALDGDTVKISVIQEAGSGQSKRAEGHVQEIIRRSQKPFVGVLHIVGEQAWVLMQGKNMPYDIVVPMGADRPGCLIPSDGESYRLFKIYDEEGNEIKVRNGEKVSVVV